jgi:type I restriction-modification system DNA methylase subunit
MTSISNDEELAEYFHSIHTFIRNKFGLYGKSALQFFNFFFVLRLVEDHIPTLIEITYNDEQIQVNCKYYFIQSIQNEEEKIQQVQYIKHAIVRTKHKETFFMNFPIDKFTTSSKAGTSLSDFLKKLDILTPEIMDKFHVYGRVYEYFLGHILGRSSGTRSGSQISDLGQYFSSRHLVRYCISKVNPIMKNTEIIPSMGDLYCGSGGFITEYIRFMNIKYPDIKWDQNINNIYGFDTDPEIIKSARVDIMTLTKTFDPSNNIFIDNFRNVNTFEENCMTNNGIPIRLDYNMTNPPYGNSGKGSIDDKLTIHKAGDEIKHVAKYGSINNMDYPKGSKKPTKAKPYLINGDNKETLAMLHGMGVLADGGTYCGVLKEGCFFDKKFSDLRKYLSTYYDVEYVISVPSDDFINTSTKTSILIFHNTKKKTTEIKFCELQVIKIKDEDNRERVIGFDEINPQSKKLIHKFYSENYEFVKQTDDYIRVGFKELEKNNFSFNFKNYIKEDIQVGNGFKIIKLGQIIKFINKGKRLASFADENGKYTYYSSGSKVLKCNEADIQNKLCVIIGHSGNGCLFLDETFSTLLTNHVISCDDKYLLTYIYYYLKYNWDKFYNQCYSGSTVLNTSDENISNYEIPIPESIDTIKLYLDYLEPANQTLQTLQTLQTQKEASICGKIKLLTTMGEQGVDYDEYKLGDICYVKAGPYLKSDEKNDGIYPIIGGGNASGTINRYDYEDDWVIHKDGISNKIISYIKGKFFVNHHGWIIKIKNNFSTLLTKQYLGYFILSNTKNYLYQLNGSNQKGLNQETFYSFNIRILKPSIISKYKLDDDFEFMDKLKNDIQNTLQTQEEITKQMMTLILNTTINHNIEDNIINDEINEESANDEIDDETNDEIDDETNEVVLEPKKKSTTKKTNDNIIVESKKKSTTKKPDNDIIVESKKKSTKSKK